LKLVGVKIST